MPQVPSYQNPQVQSQALPDMRINVRPDPNAFGAGASAEGVTRATDQMAGVLQKIQMEEKRKADQVMFMEADAKLSAAQIRMEYDPEIGYQNRKGKDAFSIPETLKTDWDKNVSEIEATLTSDEAKFAFRKSAMSRYSDLDRGVQRHVSGEIKAYDAQTTEAYLQNSANEAISHFQDPERVALALKRTEDALVAFSERNDVPEEVMKLKIEQAKSKIHVSVMDRMLGQGNDLAASQYFEANKEFIKGKDLEKAAADMQEGSLRGASQREADEILKQTTSLGKGLEMARQIEDPKLRDAVSDRVKREFSDRKMAENDQNEKRHIRALNTLEKYKDISKIPPGEWNQFSASERSSLRSYERNLREGRQPETDWGAYYEAQTLASTPQTRAAFMQTNLVAKYRPIMADTEFKELMNLQKGLRQNDEGTSKKLDHIRSNSKIVEDTLRAAGIDPDSKKNDDKVLVALALRKADEEMAAIQQRTGKSVTPAEVQAIADNLVVKGVTQKGFFYNTTKPIFALEEGETVDITIKDIPAPEKKKIQELLKRRNLPDSDTSILELYKQTKLKGKTRGL